MSVTDDKTLETFVVILARQLKKHGVTKVMESLLSLEYQEDDTYFNRVLDYIFDSVCDEFCVVKKDLIGKESRGIVSVSRKIAVILTIENLGVSDDKVAFHFKRVRQSIYFIRREFEKLDRDNKIDKQFFEKYDKLNKKIVKFIYLLKNSVIEGE